MVHFNKSLIAFFLKHHRTFYRYIFVGVCSAFIELILFSLLMSIERFPLLGANSIAYTIVFVFNFVLQRNFAFRSDKPFFRQMISYFMLWVINLNLSNFIVVFASTTLGIEPIIAKIFSMAFLIPTNFILYRTLIFK